MFSILLKIYICECIYNYIIFILFLQSNISDINQIFKDLGALVYDQGEVIDSIEASVERTEVSVNEGASQVRQASMYQTKLRKKKCILIVIAVVVLAILIGIIVWQSK